MVSFSYVLRLVGHSLAVYLIPRVSLGHGNALQTRSSAGLFGQQLQLSYSYPT